MCVQSMSECLFVGVHLHYTGPPMLSRPPDWIWACKSEHLLGKGSWMGLKVLPGPCQGIPRRGEAETRDNISHNSVSWLWPMSAFSAVLSNLLKSCKRKEQFLICPYHPFQHSSYSFPGRLTSPAPATWLIQRIFKIISETTLISISHLQRTLLVLIN